MREITTKSPRHQEGKRELPSGWRWVRLGEVCTQDRRIIESGSRDAAALPYLSLEHIEPNTGQITNVSFEPVGDEGQSTTFAFDSRHVLYGKLRPYLNKVALPDFRGRCTTEAIPLLPAAGVDRGYLCWVLRRSETVDAAMRDKTGSRMPRADLAELMSVPVPLPPLAEQKRIAAILNEQMAAVERARAAAQVQRDDAKALPAAYLRQIFLDPTTAQWPTRPLGEVADIASGITLGRGAGGAQTRRIPYLRVANVKDGYLDLSDVFEIEATEAEILKLRLQRGDLLFTEGGDPDKLGRGTYWQAQLPECVHQNHIFRARFDLDRFSPSFVASQFGSPYGKAYFLRHAKRTTGIATINQRVLRAFPLMTPPLVEQERIAAKLTEELAAVESLRAALVAQLDQINALPAALLLRAFSGEL